MNKNILRKNYKLPINMRPTFVLDFFLISVQTVDFAKQRNNFSLYCIKFVSIVMNVSIYVRAQKVDAADYHINIQLHC